MRAPPRPRLSLAVREERFGRVVVVFMALGFLALLVAGGAAAWATRRTQVHTFWVNHTYTVVLDVADLRRRLEEGEAVRRGAMISPGPTFARAYAEAADPIPGLLEHLRTLTRDNPHQVATLGDLEHLLIQQRARQLRTFQLIADGRRVAAISAYDAEVAEHPMTAIRARFDRVAAEERRLLAIRDADQRRSVRTFYIVLSLATVLLLVVATLSILVIRRFARDLTRSRDSLRALSESLEDEVKVRTADLSRANEEIQRFAYIVSHDLRSPLVNVMGFTAELEASNRNLAALVEHVEAAAPELLTEDARLAAREDLPEAIGFIRTSTQKMDRLINAILKLSREGRRVLSPEPIDVAQMAGTIRDSLRHLLDERGATLTIDEPAPTIVTDRLALEQVLSNLIENAVKYLKAGRPGVITVRGGRDGARVFVEVEDNGRGIAAADHQRVFDLFRRSGAQDQPGEGIGLAHVRALVQRLGGVVDMRSELGQGAVFRVTLPGDTQGDQGRNRDQGRA